MWEWKWEKEKELGWESLANDVRDFDWQGALERKCSVKKWGASGGKVGQIGRNRVVKEWGERVKWEGDLRVGRMW